MQRPAAPDRTIRLHPAELTQARDELCTVDSGRIDAVSVGTPHFSRAEFAELARLLNDGAPFADNVEFWVSTSRHVLEQAERAGHAAVCRAAGARIVVDTCTYVTPMLEPSTEVVMTNSAKWAWYAPSNIGVEVVFGTLAECVASARSGRVRRDPAAWEAQ